MAFAHERRKIVQFVEVGRGDGAHSLLAQFARFLAVHQRLRILLAINGETADVRRVLGAAEWTDDPEGIPAEARTQMGSVRRHGHIPLHIARFPKRPSPPAHPLDPDPVSPAFEALRQAFDWVLMGMPAAADCQDYLLFSHNSDGIILILEAGKTRWQAAQKVKTCLASQGGNLLGAILNNRRYPIPEMIYARL
jgi:Mrp family chromosome partitioning ATPase